jgi:hypothetical protein
MNLQILREKLENHKTRSCWAAGVKEYAHEIIDTLENVEEWEQMNKGEYEYTGSKQNHIDALNGAKDWKQYSRGGCSLVYDGSIARTLCSPSELERTKDGQRRPNKSEDWLDVQARALYQAQILLDDLAAGRA